MSSIQRRRGLLLEAWPARATTDSRGNTVYAVDLDEDPIVTTAVAAPQRSARAEVPGQAQIQITRLILKNDLPDVNIWSRFRWVGKWWDAVTPPAYHHGTRHTRHWTLDIRERP